MFHTKQQVETNQPRNGAEVKAQNRKESVKYKQDKPAWNDTNYKAWVRRVEAFGSVVGGTTQVQLVTLIMHLLP